MNLKDWNVMQPILQKMHEGEVKSMYQKGLVQIVCGAILIPICFLILWGFSWVLIAMLVYKANILDLTDASIFTYSLYLAVMFFLFFIVGSFFVDFEKLRNFEVAETRTISNIAIGHADSQNISNFVIYFLYVAPRFLYVGSKDLVAAKRLQMNQHWEHAVYYLYGQRNAIEITSLAQSVQLPEESLYKLLEQRHEDVVIVARDTNPRVSLANGYVKKLEMLAGIEANF